MPRSPSRDRSDRYIGNRGYFRDPDRLRRLKTRAVVAGVAFTAAWVVVEFALPSRAVTFHTHGDLIAPHAAWANDCAACHKAHGVAEVSVGGVFAARDRWHDLTCEKCHAGPAHHETVADAAFHDRCSNCHHDHGGKANSLTRIADSHCTRCHTELEKNRRPVAGDWAAADRYAAHGDALAVTDFATKHPEFAALHDYPADKPYEPRRLKFSHALHMTPGLRYTAGGKEALTVGRAKAVFGEATAERYGGAAPAEALIQLDCAACHQLDAGRPRPAAFRDDPALKTFDRLSGALAGEARASILPPRAEGAYYLPVNFDAHCKACHPIHTPAATSGGTTLDEFALPHRRQPAELKALLKGEYAARLAFAGNPGLAAAAGPGGRLDPAAAPAVATFGAETDRLAADATRTLFLGLAPREKAATAPAADQYRLPAGGYACGKCHYRDGPDAAPSIAPIPDRTVWFAHAKFDHVAHRGQACASCHPGTDPPAAPPGAVNETEPVLIWGIDSCRACHAPAGTAVKQPNGQAVSALGTRSACTDCHRYHNGDRPLQGRGAAARDPRAPLDLADFLNGGRK